MRRSLSCIVAVVLACPLFARADLDVAPIFGDHMVVQRSKPLRVFGTAKAGDEVKASIAGKSATAKAGSDGEWIVELPTIEEAGPFSLKVESGADSETFEDVLAGEVWLCSGQSNMEWKLADATGGKEAIAAADMPKMRIFLVKKARAIEPQDKLIGEWVVVDSKSIGNFSAVGYFFGSELQKTLNVPVGLVGSYWGGTMAESWISAKTLATLPQKRTMLDAQLAKRAAATQPSNAPIATELYNAMIAPIGPLSLRGTIWYQGESNAGRASEYQGVMTGLIGEWRAQFQDRAMPFYFVQLAGFQANDENLNGQQNWAALRESQRKTALELPHTGMASAIDIGELKDIHPRNKQDVGHRLALIALHETYGKADLDHTGPIVRSAVRDGSRVKLSFDTVGGPAAFAPDLMDKAFQLADASGTWRYATAQPGRDGTITLQAEGVETPTKVRYAYANSPAMPVRSVSGLPAVPFEMDVK